MMVLLWACWLLEKRVNSYSHVLTVAEGLGTFVMVTRSPQATTSASRHDGTAAPQKGRLGLQIKELLSAVHVNIIWATVAVAEDCRLVHLPPGDSGQALAMVPHNNKRRRRDEADHRDERRVHGLRAKNNCGKLAVCKTLAKQKCA